MRSETSTSTRRPTASRSGTGAARAPSAGPSQDPTRETTRPAIPPAAPARERAAHSRSEYIPDDFAAETFLVARRGPRVGDRDNEVADLFRKAQADSRKGRRRGQASAGEAHQVTDYLPATQKALPSGSVSTTHRKSSPNSCRPVSVAPSPTSRPTSASRSAAVKSMCTRFLPGVGSSTFWKASRGPSGAGHGDEKAGCYGVSRAVHRARPPLGESIGVLAVERDHLHIECRVADPRSAG